VSLQVDSYMRRSAFRLIPHCRILLISELSMV
jgi:hypothetical protein